MGLATLQAVGMIEFNSVAAGIQGADVMVKAASVGALMMKTVCPGKFVVAVHADVGSVQAAMDAGLEAVPGTVLDHFVIPNIDPAVIQAMSCATDRMRGAALGVVETFSAASCIVAADTGVKAADVDLVEVRIAMGLGGKAFCLMAGDVGPVEMAVAAAAAAAGRTGMLVRQVVIPSLAPQVRQHIL
jgi:microcompartment protein CcmL/EutN